MTASTFPGESNLVPTAGITVADSNYDLSSAEGTLGLPALRESLSVEQRQAMARDDVPECVASASLRRRLSGPVPYVELSRTIAVEGDELLLGLIEEGEEGAAPAPDHNRDTDQESDGFTVYITMTDGFVAAVTLSGRSAEVGSFSKMSSQERVAFAASDEKEWDAILSAGAVRILSPKESDEVRRSHPDRIITSRMIRRWKPGDSVDAPPVAKSRWCIRGYQDPDSGGALQVFAPTPTTLAMYLFLIIAQTLELELAVADCKNAFCQSDELKREAGKLYVIPCEGLNLDKKTFLEAIKPVYGLDDAPMRWHKTFTDYLKSLGFRRTLLEACWYVLYSETGRLQAMVLIEVDDLLVAATLGYKKTLREAMHKRFIFGQCEEPRTSATFAGRTLEIRTYHIGIHFEKYIKEELKLVSVTRGRLSQKS